MNEISQGFELKKVYIYYILVFSKVDWGYCLNKMELALYTLKEKDLNYNNDKFFFGQT